MNTEKVCSRESNRYEAILEAAAESFFKKGFEGTSIRSIMKQTGAEAGLFYYYFADKSDVFPQLFLPITKDSSSSRSKSKSLSIR